MKQKIDLYFFGGVNTCEVITFAEAQKLNVRYVCSVEGYDIYESENGTFYAVR